MKRPVNIYANASGANPYEWNHAVGDDGKQRRGLRPIPLAPCYFFFFLVVVGGCLAVPAAAHAGPVFWPSSYSDLSAPASPNSKLQPSSSGIINRLVWIEAEAEAEEE